MSQKVEAITFFLVEAREFYALDVVVVGEDIILGGRLHCQFAKQFLVRRIEAASVYAVGFYGIECAQHTSGTRIIGVVEEVRLAAGEGM